MRRAEEARQESDDLGDGDFDGDDDFNDDTDDTDPIVSGFRPNWTDCMT